MASLVSPFLAPQPFVRDQPYSVEIVRKVKQIRTVATWQESIGVLAVSAIPFTAVKALAGSPWGGRLRERAERERERAEEEERSGGGEGEKRRKARESSSWYGPARPKFLGPLPFDYPQYLGGEVAGDYGFDIFGLGKEPKAFDKNFNFEIFHGRWAMLGALGAVFPELLSFLNDDVALREPVWWRVGEAKLQGDTLDYLGVPGLYVAGGEGVVIIAIAQFLLMFGPEYARFCGIRALEPLGIYLPGDVNYPGGILFDPLGLSKNAESFEDLKVKEIKHARVAMVAWLGFFAQAALTRKGPIENLIDFVNDPLHENLFSYIQKGGV